LLFFSASKKEQKGRARSTAKPMCLSSLCLEFAGSLPFVSNFVLRISDSLTAEGKKPY